MNISRFGDLEVFAESAVRGGHKAHPAWHYTRKLLGLEGAAAAPSERPPLLFVHGACTAAWCWKEHFLKWFAAHGYDAYAVSLSGHGASRQRELLDMYGIDDYVADVTQVAAALPRTPILIGHSMGGMVVQKYLERGKAAAAILMASVPPSGLFGSAMNLLLNQPLLLQDANHVLSGTPVSERIGAALFHHLPATEDLQRYAELAQRESARALWDMTCFNLPQLFRMSKVPTLVLGGAQDQIIAPSQVEATATAFGAQLEMFPEMGHGLMLEPGWDTVAAYMLAWMQQSGL